MRPSKGLLLVACMLVAGPVAAQQQPALNAYAVLGLESVRVGRGVLVQPGAVVAVRTGPKAAVAATIFAPNAAVVLGAGGDHRGAFVGRSVTVRPRSRAREASAFPPL